MNEIDIRIILNSTAVLLLLLFSLFLFFNPSRRQLSNRLLGAFLLANAFAFTLNMISGSVKLNYTATFLIDWGSFIFDAWVGPLIYLYTRSMLNTNFKLKQKDMFHLVPSICILFYLSLRLFNLSFNEKAAISDNLSSAFAYEKSVFILAIHLILVIYAICSVRRLNGYIKETKNNFSSIEESDLSWIKSILGGFGAVWAMVIINYFLQKAFGSYLGFLDYFPVLILLLVANLIIFKLIKEPRVFFELDLKSEQKYRQSPLTEQEVSKLAGHLQTVMDRQKPYLIAGLTLKQLSEKSSIPLRHLSQTINEYFNCSFFDYVNSYRIEEAKMMLQNNPEKQLSMSDVIFESGFNSKAPFNRAFKKYVDESPSAYRKRFNRSK